MKDEDKTYDTMGELYANYDWSKPITEVHNDLEKPINLIECKKCSSENASSLGKLMQEYAQNASKTNLC